jgi:hypothetical protein
VCTAARTRGGKPELAQAVASLDPSPLVITPSSLRKGSYLRARSVAKPSDEYELKLRQKGRVCGFNESLHIKLESVTGALHIKMTPRAPFQKPDIPSKVVAVKGASKNLWLSSGSEEFNRTIAS